MRFGIREICDVVLRAKATQILGSRKFYKNEPVLYFDTLKTSSLEGQATTVYATGGRGNSRLIAWEGERTLTFTMEDALLSMESFSILTGAGLIAATNDAPIYVHQTSQVEVEAANTIVLPTDKVVWNGYADEEDPHFKLNADIFVMVLNDNGEVNAEPCIPVGVEHGDGITTLTCYSHAGYLPVGTIVLVDYYVKRVGGASMIEITPDKFGGFYYLEASTLFRREADGFDMPAEFIIPKCKVQSSFNFAMAATGDPSTFTFTMDAFPDYTKFDRTHKVLAAIQIIEDYNDEEDEKREPCKENNKDEIATEGADVKIEVLKNDDQYAVALITGDSDGDEYDAGTFPGGNTGVQINLNLPINGAGTYRVVQKNAGLEYFTSDPAVSNTAPYKKDKSYTLDADQAEDGFEYQFLVTDKGGPITVQFYDATGLVKTYEFITKVNFA